MLAQVAKKHPFASSGSSLNSRWNRIGVENRIGNMSETQQMPIKVAVGLSFGRYPRLMTMNDLE